MQQKMKPKTYEEINLASIYTMDGKKLKRLLEEARESERQKILEIIDELVKYEESYWIFSKDLKERLEK